jgi:hypothetical protein
MYEMAYLIAKPYYAVKKQQQEDHFIDELTLAGG